jgi:hypothetical protein
MWRVAASDRFHLMLDLDEAAAHWPVGADRDTENGHKCSAPLPLPVSHALLTL